MLSLLDSQNPLVGINISFIVVILVVGAVFFICFSGFVKFSIVLSIIKNAIGTQQIPPNIVVNMLAALMALHVIFPYIQPGISRIEPLLYSSSNNNNKNSNNMSSIYPIIKKPFSFFPELLTLAKEKTNKLRKNIDLPFDFTDVNNNISYIISALIFDIYKGFEIGLKLYLVFVTIDFLVAIILNGAGMSMLSPTVISIPIKLSVFYLSNSWAILFKIMN